MVKSSINGLFSMAMLNNQMVSSVNQTWLAGNSLTKTEVSFAGKIIDHRSVIVQSCLRTPESTATSKYLGKL